MKVKFYQKTWFKNIILIFFPTLISSLGVIISLVEVKAIVKQVIIFSIILLTLILIVAVVFFSTQDDKIYVKYQSLLEDYEKLRGVLAYLENDLRTCNVTILTFSELFENWSKTIYDFVDKVQKENEISDIAWNKVEYFNFICAHCKKMILQYLKITDISKISVNFVMPREDENGEIFVRMVAHSDSENIRPNACKKEEKLSDSVYHHSYLIKVKYSDIEVKVSNLEIRTIFKNVGPNTDLSKYTQYIAIPVYCSNDKLLGIFQVEAKYNCIINKDTDALRTFAQEKINPYCNLIVLIDKITKGLYVTPKKQDEEIG